MSPEGILMGGVSGADALTAGLKSQIDLTGASDFSNWDLGTFSLSAPPPLPTFKSTQGDIYENISATGGAYRQSIDGGSLNGYLPPSQDAGGLADFFRQGQTLNWYEDVLDGNYQEVAGYTGTASLVSFSGDAAAVPEPATWALMVLGLGGMGAALRRRGVGARAA